MLHPRLFESAVACRSWQAPLSEQKRAPLPPLNDLGPATTHEVPLDRRFDLPSFLRTASSTESTTQACAAFSRTWSPGKVASGPRPSERTGLPTGRDRRVLAGRVPGWRAC